MVVNRSHADTWKVQAETLWEDAVKNVKNLLPAEFVTMNHALKSLLGDVEYEEGDLLLEKKTKYNFHPSSHAIILPVCTDDPTRSLPETLSYKYT